MNAIKLVLKFPPVLWFLIAAGLCYLDYSSWKSDSFDPLVQQLDSVRGSLESTQSEITRAAEFVRRRDEKIRELAELGQKLESTRRELPRSASVPELLHALADTADHVGLELPRFKPLPSVRTELLVETPIDVTLKGTYLQVMSFLDAAANLTRVVAARRVSMDTPVNRGRASIVTATASLVTYHIEDGADLAPVASAADPAQETKR